MFLTNQTNGIEDFLKAVNFLKPEGMSLKYFVVPKKSGESLFDMAQSNGFEPEITENPNNVEGVTDTIVYAKKDLSNNQSVSSDKIDVTEIPEQFPITRPNQQLASQSTIQNTQPVQISTNKQPQVANTVDNREPIKTDILIGGGEVLPPNSGIKILESNERFVDYILCESISVLPKNTVLHFVRG